MSYKNIIFYVVVLMLSMADVSYGGSREANGPSLLPAERVADFAKSVEKYAAARGARVFLLSRVGISEAELPKGVSFTHTGLAVYSEIRSDDGTVRSGYAVHNLYQQEEDLSSSHLVQDYPYDFFSGVEILKAGVIIPVPKLQQKLLQSLSSSRYQNLHNSRYSIVSNPFSKRFQNCNEHLLDVLFASIYNTEDVSVIKANQRRYFEPQTIEVSPVKRLLAPVFSDSVSLSDHGSDIRFTTFTSINRFLDLYGLTTHSAVLTEESF